MYQCNFSEKDKKTIRHARIYDPNPAIRKRMGILWYKVLGYPHHEIALLGEVCNTTVTATIRRYREGGIEGSVRILLSMDLNSKTKLITIHK